MAGVEAREGHVLTVIACCSAGPVAVLASRRDAWRCGKCRSTGRDIAHSGACRPTATVSLAEQLGVAQEPADAA